MINNIVEMFRLPKEKSQNANFRSMGKVIGNYHVPDPKVVCQLISDGKIDDYCMIEVKSEYYMLFFDLDIDDKHPDLLNRLQNVDKTKFWDSIIGAITRALRHYINGEDKLFFYIYSNRADKWYKIHLFFPNIVINNVYALVIRYKVIQEIKRENPFNLTDDEIKKLVDASVFKANGLRTLYMSKRGEDGFYDIDTNLSTFKEIPQSRYERLLLTRLSRENEHAINFELIVDDTGFSLLDQDQMKYALSEKKKKDKPQKIRNGVPIKRKKEILKSDLNPEFRMALINNLNADRFDDYEKWKDFVILCGNYGWHSVAHAHSKKSAKYDEAAVDRLFYAKNNSENTITVASLFHWSRADNPVNHKRIIEKYDSSYLKQLTAEQINFTADLIYESEYLKALDTTRYKTFIIKSGLGTNKTGEVIKTITNLVELQMPNASINAIASRIVLCSNLFGRFQTPVYGEEENRPEKLGMKLYNDIEKNDRKEERRIVQTPDNLIHMINSDGQLKPPEILFIDEIKSFMKYICTSDTMDNKRKTVLAIVQYYIKSAKYVFMVDGGATNVVVDYVRSLREGDVQVIHNKKLTDPNTYFIVKNEDTWFNLISKDIRNGKNIYIASDSKTFTDLIYKKIRDTFPRIKMEIYNSETDDKLKFDLKFVDEIWTNFQVIIVSPTIVYGLDQSARHFDVIYGHYNGTLSAADMYQQMRRIRNVKSKIGFIYYKNTGCSFYPTDIEEIKRYIVNNNNLFGKRYDDLKKDVINGRFELMSDDAYTNLFVHFQKEIFETRNNFYKEFTRCFTEYGGTVKLEITKRKVQPEYLAERKKSLEELEQERINKLIEASKKVDRVPDIKMQRLRSSEDHHIMDAHKVMTIFGLDQLTPKFLMKLGHLSNVDKFYDSLIFLAGTKYHKRYIVRRCTVDVKHTVAAVIKKRTIVRRFIRLFFGHLLSRGRLKVYTESGLSADENKFIKTYLKDIRVLFDEPRKKPPTKRVQLLGWLSVVLKKYFGGFVSIDKSKRMLKRYDHECKYYHLFRINSAEYLELVCNKLGPNINKKIFEKIKSRFSKRLCAYKGCHSFTDISEVIDSWNKDKDEDEDQNQEQEQEQEQE